MAGLAFPPSPPLLCAARLFSCCCFSCPPRFWLRLILSLAVRTSERRCTTEAFSWAALSSENLKRSPRIRASRRLESAGRTGS
ncbi:unnamed protein product, partial [Prorocentrum cordatum]